MAETQELTGPIPHLDRAVARRFWKRVKKGQTDDDCWEWIGKRGGPNQYGVLSQTVQAHRISYELHYGAIPRGKFVLHSCDNPKCTNPRHLRAGSYSENLKDSYARGRRKTPITNNTLTEADVMAIRNRFLEGDTFQRLAKDFHIGEGSIRNVLRGRCWRHVQGPRFKHLKSRELHQRGTVHSTKKENNWVLVTKPNWYTGEPVFDYHPRTRTPD